MKNLLLLLFFSFVMIPVMAQTIPLPEMVSIKGGSFSMGSGFGMSDEQPSHQVRVNSFKIGKYEITLAQFRAFIEATGYVTSADTNGAYIYDGKSWKKKAGINWKNGYKGELRPQALDNFPVFNVSWYDANAYCKWLTGKLGKKLRLPTEAEWEYAAKGGSKSKGYAFAGGNAPRDVAWYEANSDDGPKMVGTKKPNELGIYDMTGNVAEWCSDLWSLEYYSRSPVDNPTGANSGAMRAIRGCGWSDLDKDCFTYTRARDFPDATYFNRGFRVVCGE